MVVSGVWNGGGGGKTSGKYVLMIMLIVVVKTARVLVIQEGAKWQAFRKQTS